MGRWHASLPWRARKAACRRRTGCCHCTRTSRGAGACVRELAARAARTRGRSGGEGSRTCRARASTRRHWRDMHPGIAPAQNAKPCRSARVAACRACSSPLPRLRAAAAVVVPHSASRARPSPTGAEWRAAQCLGRPDRAHSRGQPTSTRPFSRPLHPAGCAGGLACSSAAARTAQAATATGAPSGRETAEVRWPQQHDSLERH